MTDEEGEEEESEKQPRIERRVDSLSSENDRLRSDIERHQEEIERLRERNQQLQQAVADFLDSDHPLVYELEKTSRGSEEVPETDIERKNRINQRRKRIAYVGVFFLITFELVGFIVSNPPDTSIVAEHEVAVVAITVFLMYSEMQFEKIARDFRIDRKYPLVKDLLSEIENEQWAPWILRAIFGFLSLLIVGYFWPTIQSLF